MFTLWTWRILRGIKHNDVGGKCQIIYGGIYVGMYADLWKDRIFAVTFDNDPRTVSDIPVYEIH